MGKQSRRIQNENERQRIVRQLYHNAKTERSTSNSYNFKASPQWKVFVLGTIYENSPVPGYSKISDILI